MARRRCTPGSSTSTGARASSSSRRLAISTGRCSKMASFGSSTRMAHSDLNGPASMYARFFDINWRAGKLVVPTLGDQYGTVLENGELRVEYADGAFRSKWPGVDVRPVLRHQLAPGQARRPDAWRSVRDGARKWRASGRVRGWRIPI